MARKRTGAAAPLPEHENRTAAEAASLLMVGDPTGLLALVELMTPEQRQELRDSLAAE